MLARLRLPRLFHAVMRFNSLEPLGPARIGRGTR